MKLQELLAPWVKEITFDCEISGLSNDSRCVKPGDLFLAYPGVTGPKSNDGRNYISQALQAGAAAILYEPENCPKTISLPSDVPHAPLLNLAINLAKIASRFYHQPSESLSITAVTGTNGKTTIAYQLAQAHAFLGQPSAYIGTLGEGKAAALNPLANTTPDGLALQSFFNNYKQSHIQRVCMEVSSHALAQHRVDQTCFQQAIFTNLTHDHLDYHHTMENYAAAKALLFADPALSAAIINQDDLYAQKMIEQLSSSCQLITYGIKAKADVHVLQWEVTMEGTLIVVQSPWGIYQLHSPALGYFNIYNSLAVFSSLMLSGYSAASVLKVMQQLKSAPGRMEVVSQHPSIIVDYAHTPDALKNVIVTLNKVKKNKLIVVFGCGGDRDKTKRPIMGKIAARYADFSIITSDNPRHEDPQIILNEIEQGMEQSQQYYKIIDRQEAIAKAISMANKDDIILVAGKGHESYQQIGAIRYPFSDQQMIRRILFN